VIQEIFFRAWQKLHLFRGDAAFGTWLHRLGVNVILRQAKKTSHLELLESDLADQTAPRPDLKMDLESAVGQLPHGARKIFVLYDIEGYRHEEIAKMLGISPHTSRAQLHRARTLLRGHL
jgi:RNA polymerase sigma-70 factor (ECF subfamily)